MGPVKMGPVGCPCYLNATEINQGSGQQDRAQCLGSCKAQFQRSMLKEWEEDSGWIEGCKTLNRGAPVLEFWSLYWCDATFCGVGIAQTGGLGQDPNVDLIINTCQNIGFYSVIDPGPPSHDFRCSTEADAPGLCSFTVLQLPEATDSPQSSTGGPQPAPRITVSPTATSTQPGPTPVVASSGSPSAGPTAGVEGSAAMGTSTTSESTLTGQGKAAVAVSAALALIFLVSSALVWLRRRKRRKAAFHRALCSRGGVTAMPAAGSSTPLISPTSSAIIGAGRVLTPPLRLRDRKFLPSILRPGSRSPSPPLTPLTPAYSPQPGAAVFPCSPICSPTTSKLVPRHERTPRTYAASGPAPPVSPASTLSLPVPVLPGASWPAADASRASASSYSYGGTTARSSLRYYHHDVVPLSVPFLASAGGTTTTSTRGSNSTSSSSSTPPPPPPAPPGSPTPSASSPSLSAAAAFFPPPTRPPRPHDGMLEIPDLVTPAAAWSSISAASRASGTPPPASPPPSRALPRVPVSSLSSIGGGKGGGIMAGGRAAEAVRCSSSSGGSPAAVGPGSVLSDHHPTSRGGMSYPTGCRSATDPAAPAPAPASVSVSVSGSGSVRAAGVEPLTVAGAVAGAGAGAGVRAAQGGKAEREQDPLRGSWGSWSAAGSNTAVGK